LQGFLTPSPGGTNITASRSLFFTVVPQPQRLFYSEGGWCQSLDSVYFEPRRMPYLALPPSFSGVLGGSGTPCTIARLMPLASLVFLHCPTKFRTRGTRQKTLNALCFARLHRAPFFNIVCGVVAAPPRRPLSFLSAGFCRRETSISVLLAYISDIEIGCGS